LTEFAPVGIFRTDVNGVTNYVNPRYCEISKMNSEEAMGNGWLNAVHPEDRSLLDKEWQHAALSGSQSYSEYRFLHSDGSVTWVNGHAVPLKDQGGDLVGYIGAIEDMTDRKRAEEKLIESEAYYRTLIDISPDGIITSDIKGNVTYGSKKAYEIFEEPPGVSFIGTSVLNWLDTEYHQQILKRFSDIISGNVKPVTGEYKLLKHDRSAFWAELSSCPITDAKGNTSGLLIVCRDISERKKAEEELIKARDKAEEGDKLKTAFLHNISHEIRTPMNAITGFSALLGEPELTPETQKSYIDIITQSSDHLLDVLNDIIEISNIEAGILKSKKIEINVNTLIGKLYKQFKHPAEEKGIELKYRVGLSEKRAAIVTDYAKLIQILSNLLSNSLKFTLHGQIEFGYNLKNEKLEFFVSDSGIGISEDEHQKIFERFYQVEHSLTRVYEGTGLGLSISMEYVELMKGNILLTSEPGHGSVFYFTIPYTEVVSDQKMNPPTDEAVKPSEVEKKTLLVAEDDNNNFYLIRELLSELNVKIVRASNGIEAVNICKSDLKIDLVLMDIKMPFMDGYTAIREILDYSPSLKIIAQTAYGDDEARCMEAGCAGFISKPFVKKQFIKLVKEFL
jgi:PAS domain S-box-containing protein